MLRTPFSSNPADALDDLSLSFRTHEEMDLCESASDKLPTSRVSPRLVKMSHGDGAPIFLIHAADGGIEIYEPLVRVFQAHRSVFVVEDALLHSQTPASQLSVEELASDYLEQIQSVQAEGPYHIGGYSFGGLVAYAVALRLVAMGESVGNLFLLEAHNPTVPLKGRSPKERMATFLRTNDRGLWKVPLMLAHRIVTGAATRLKYEAVMRLAKKASSRPRSYLRRRWVQQCNDEAFEAYAPCEAYTGPCDIWISEDQGDKFVPAGDLGWSGFLPSLKGRHQVPGNHLDFMKPTNMERVGHEIDTILERSS